MNPTTVTIQANTATELKEKICALAAIFGMSANGGGAQLELPLGAPGGVVASEAPVSGQSETQATEPKRTRKPKASKEAKTVETAPAAATEASEVFPNEPKTAEPEIANLAISPVEATENPRQVATNALSALMEAKGVAIGRETLAKFGATRIGELKEADYLKFAAACKAASQSQAA